MKPCTIGEIMDGREDALGRIALQSSWAKRTIFIPWAYDKRKDEWIGITRWEGNNNRGLHISRMKGDRQIWTLFKEKWPIIPYNHEFRPILERYKNKYLKKY